MAYIGNKPTVGNFQICDAISVVNGQAAYTMQVGSVNVIPQSANHMIVSLNGTIQKPNSSYTVANSVITFSSNLATGDVIDFIQILGDVLDLGVPSDATVTNAKLTSGSFSNITGTGTLTGFTSTGIDDNASANSILIDSSGHVTKPLQPAVHAYSSSAQNDIANGIVTIQLNAEVYDVNSDFNTSNYTFTAPVTGKYLVSSNVDLTDIDTATQWLYGALIVTSNRNYYASLIDPRNLNSDSNQSFSSSTLVDMDANDTLVLKVRSSAHGAAQMNVTTVETYMTIVLSC